MLVRLVVGETAWEEVVPGPACVMLSFSSSCARVTMTDNASNKEEHVGDQSDFEFGQFDLVKTVGTGEYRPQGISDK